jgi:thiol:disulfide interchange protein DsbA
MRPLRRRLTLTALTVLLGFAAGSSAVVPVPAFAAPAEPQDGVEYQTLASPQPTDTGSKVEVIEFFAYYCPHCYAFEPGLEAWVKAQGENIVFKRVHVSGGAAVAPQQRLFYTLDAMGLLPQYHQKVFDAIHVEHQRLANDEQVLDWAAKNGIDRAKFAAVYNSFGIGARVRRVDSLMDAYHVEFWPLVVIDGRYLTSPTHAGKRMPEGSSEAQQQQATLQVMDALVAKAKAAKAK